MRYFTFRKVALAHKLRGQVLRFTGGKGYWLLGKPKPDTGPLTMYDSVSVPQIPKGAKAVAGYVGGHWPTAKQLAADFPHAHRLTIAVSASEDARCLDVEPGDATTDQAAAWVRRQLRRGVKKPVVYTSVSNAENLVRALSVAGVTRSSYCLWTAHYTDRPHLCSSACGFGSVLADATQYTDHALGRNLDASYVSSAFFA